MLKTKINNKSLRNILIMLLFGSTIFGFVLSQVAGSVLFVKRIGAEFLPYTYIANAIFGSVLGILFSAKVGSTKTTTLIQRLAIISIFGYLIIFWGIRMGFQASYTSLVVFSYIVYLLLMTVLMWDVAIKLCTPFEAKKNFGYFSLGGSLGGILAGTAVSLSSSYWPTEYIIFLIIGSLAVVWLVSGIIERKFWINAEQSEEKKQFSLELSNAFQSFKSLRLAKLVALSIILFHAIRLVADYQFQKILGQTFEEERLTEIFGTVSMVENAILIVIFIFVQRRLLVNIGVLKTYALVPVILGLPFSLLLAFPNYLIASILKVTTRVLNYSIFASCIRLIMTAIPVSIRTKMITFIGSISESAGILMAGISLLIFNKLISDQWIITCAVALALVLLIVIFFIRREYTKQIVINLKSSSTQDLHTAIENLAEPEYDRIGVNELMKLLKQQALDEKTTKKIVFALGKIDNMKIIPALLDLFESRGGNIKYSVIEAINGFSNLKEGIRKYPFTKLNILETYKKDLIHNDDSELKVMILKSLKFLGFEEVTEYLVQYVDSKQGVKIMRYFHDRGIIRYIKPLLKSKSPESRSYAVIALWQFKELRPELLVEVIKVMESNEPQKILGGLLIIRELNFSWESEYAHKFVTHQDEQIRAMAILTLMMLENDQGLSLAVNYFIGETKYSRDFISSFKHLSERSRFSILKQITSLEEESVNHCISLLESSYLNFSDELNFLGKSQ